MPYIRNDEISQVELIGGIEITSQQYNDLLAAKLDGKEITVMNNQPFIYSGDKRAIYKLINNEIASKQIRFEDPTDADWQDTEPTPEPINYTNASKLKLMKKMKTLGLWAALKAQMQADEDIWDEWLVAGDVKIDYPPVVAIRDAMGWTAQQLQDLFNEINIENN